PPCVAAATFARSPGEAAAVGHQEEPETGQELPHFVVQLAGETATLGLLQLDQAAREDLELRRRRFGRAAGGPFVLQEARALGFGALAIRDVEGGADQTDGAPGRVHQKRSEERRGG